MARVSRDACVVCAPFVNLFVLVALVCWGHRNKAGGRSQLLLTKLVQPPPTPNVLKNI
jgi:hypothetical protein